MNPHTASEHIAAITLREHAALLVAGYAKPEDLPSARLGLLMHTAQLESLEQSTKEAVILVSLEALDAIHRYVNHGMDDDKSMAYLRGQLASILESISYEVQE